MSSGASTYRIANDVLSAPLGANEITLMDSTRETFLSLEGPAHRIWQLLTSPCTLDQITERLVAEYDVDPVTCAEDTSAFLEELVARGVLSRGS